MLLSTILGIFNKKSDTALNELVLKAKSGDGKVMDDLLIAFTPFMKKTASFVCKRFIDEHDDEFSIAMNGFHEAIVAFDPNRDASLTTFSHLIIKRRLVDHIRKETARNETVQLLKEEDSNQRQYVFEQTSIDFHSKEQQDLERQEELLEYAKLLSEYDLSFDELTNCSPKHAKSRKIAFQIAQIIAETPDLYIYVTENKKLPIKELEEIVEVSRKTIERHRKYIIAVSLLLQSQFVYIKEYIKGELR
ncbi:RNA polymerase sigma-I factor [Sporosarcina sp. FSL W7-1349]|uniref:RNA polymerase sigma-I factor n=1 Tax=Sporosarcina sp. FSL W7-1349 TaxID=2921561 RepID=UPI0030F7614E